MTGFNNSLMGMEAATVALEELGVADVGDPEALVTVVARLEDIGGATVFDAARADETPVGGAMAVP